MYSLNNVLIEFNDHLRFIWQYFPYIVLHFIVLLVLRVLLLKYFSNSHAGGFIFAGIVIDAGQGYQMCLLFCMVLFSFVLSIVLYDISGTVFYFGNDFVFLAGIFLGDKRGLLILVLNILALLYWLIVRKHDNIWFVYILLDAVIYFLVGLLSRTWLYMAVSDFSWHEIILICMGKIIACALSAACWVLLMQESWFAGFNVLLFRLAGWPLISLPMMGLYILLMRLDVRQFAADP